MFNRSILIAKTNHDNFYVQNISTFYSRLWKKQKKEDIGNIYIGNLALES